MRQMPQGRDGAGGDSAALAERAMVAWPLCAWRQASAARSTHMEKPTKRVQRWEHHFNLTVVKDTCGRSGSRMKSE